ncbi:HNH endonuclease [Micromonospora chersina]|uniref:HNH endonuclease n=1 Tax=Micromonospora chersina TaxID=47854 RepID=UPI0033E99EA8
MTETQERRDPPALEIARWWLKNQDAAIPDKVFVYDLGEPSCFACGWYDDSRPTYPEVSLARAWAKSRLQRAHLTPHALGGSNHPSNYLMLCKQCHDEAPDWRDPSMMLQWAKTRVSYISRFQADLLAAWEALRPGQPLPANLIEEPSFTDALRNLLYANAGTHFGIGLKRSTIVAALAAVADDQARPVHETPDLPLHGTTEQPRK